MPSDFWQLLLTQGAVAALFALAILKITPLLIQAFLAALKTQQQTFEKALEDVQAGMRQIVAQLQAMQRAIEDLAAKKNDR
jgi:threonyl-tRNA synthetase